MILAVFIAYGGGELTWAGSTVYNIAAGILLLLLIGTVIRPRNWGVWLGAGIAYIIAVVAIAELEPLPRYDINDSAILRVHIPVITSVLVLLTLLQAVRIYRVGSIRTRLLISSVATVTLTAAAISVAFIAVDYESRRQQAFNALQVVTSLKESQLDAWVAELQGDLASVALQTRQHARTALAPYQEDTAAETMAIEATWALRSTLLNVTSQIPRFDDLMVIGREGEVIASSDSAQEGLTLSDEMYFRMGLQGPYIHPPFTPPGAEQAVLIVAQPLSDEGGNVIGVLAGHSSLAAVDEILAQRTGMGRTGTAYLVDEDYTLLTASQPQETRGNTVHSPGIDAVIQEQEARADAYDDYRGVPVMGAYRWLPVFQAGLLTEQEQSEAFEALFQVLRIIAMVAVFFVLVAITSSLFLIRSVATPMADLAETAAQIAAGDLDQVAKVEREDEIGMLARAFNSMTGQLRAMISGLEQRVAERTQELEQRSGYLEAAAEVGRAASSILEPEGLIDQTVTLIRDEFDLYFVGLFLVDPTREWAVLRAGTGEGGRAMLARGHRLRVSEESMVGWCIANQESRIALEAGEDAVRLATPELPDTRSEAALPLRSRGEVIGALTVQHTEPGAFDQDTIVVLQTMADQVAVALDNARLFAESQEALDATQRAYGDVSREAWNRLLSARTNLGYRSESHGIFDAGDLWRPEMEQAFQSGQTIQGNNASDEGRRMLAVPIKVRGQVVGVLDTYKPVEAGDWTPEEITLLETIAEQLDSALESARLYQDTQRRAAREEAIREATEQMRSAIDVETILQHAVAELTKAMGVPRAYVRLGTEAELQPGTDSLGTEAGPQPGTDLQPATVPAEEGAAGREEH
jgi:GAF domain-containing protein/HAMP domain-containing protein